jgi:hypothetical protein
MKALYLVTGSPGLQRHRAGTMGVRWKPALNTFANPCQQPSTADTTTATYTVR